MRPSVVSAEFIHEHAQEPVGGTNGMQQCFERDVTPDCLINWLVTNLNWATRFHFPLYLTLTAQLKHAPLLWLGPYGNGGVTPSGPLCAIATLGVRQ